MKELAGFTLIEIMLTLSIMSVLSLFGIVTYRDYNQNRLIDSAGHQIQDVLLLARSRASTQVKPDVTACSLDRVLYGYEVKFCPDNCTTSQNFALSVACGDNGEYVQKIGNSYVLPAGVTFASNQPQTILFRVLSGEVAGTSGIVVNGYGSMRTISVSSTGVVAVTQ